MPPQTNGPTRCGLEVERLAWRGEEIAGSGQADEPGTVGKDVLACHMAQRSS